jgi:hypothetical protein
MWKAELGFASIYFALLMARACFVAGTPLLTPDGHKPIEEFHAGDLVLARNEDNPESPVVARRVVQIFKRSSLVFHVHVNGRIIGTTGEHPFWVIGKGWTPAKELRLSDRLLSHDGQAVEVLGVEHTGRYETVYNLEVEEDHTYFVGAHTWGWSVWAHNACKDAPDLPSAQQTVKGHLRKALGIGRFVFGPRYSTQPLRGNPNDVIVYWVIDIRTREILKVGDTTVGGAVARWGDYLKLARREGRTIEIEYIRFDRSAPRHTPSVEDAIRRMMELQRNKLPWDWERGRNPDDWPQAP